MSDAVHLGLTSHLTSHEIMMMNPLKEVLFSPFLHLKKLRFRVITSLAWSPHLLHTMFPPVKEDADRHIGWSEGAGQEKV